MNSLEIHTAANIIHQGGVVAYPTESCFGLGCDPTNTKAVRRILHMKRRSRDKGLILIADRFSRFQRYVETIPAPLMEEVFASWPGPFTWLLPAKSNVSRWLRGEFDSLAVRVTAHRYANRLCQVARTAVVSTSANRAGCPALTSAAAVRRAFGNQVDFVLPGSIGTHRTPSVIRDGLTGDLVRG